MSLKVTTQTFINPSTISKNSRIELTAADILGLLYRAGVRIPDEATKKVLYNGYRIDSSFPVLVLWEESEELEVFDEKES